LAQYTRPGWHSLPPHDALHAIYQHGDVLARFAAAARAASSAMAVLANLRALLSAALQHGGGRYLTPYALVRALRARRHPARPAAPMRRRCACSPCTAPRGWRRDCRADARHRRPARRRRQHGRAGRLARRGKAAPRRFVFLASETSPPPSATEAAWPLSWPSRASAKNSMPSTWP
jgi:ATP-dependent helicase/nuclease subunit A